MRRTDKAQLRKLRELLSHDDLAVVRQGFRLAVSLRSPAVHSALLEQISLDPLGKIQGWNEFFPSWSFEGSLVHVRAFLELVAQLPEGFSGHPSIEECSTLSLDFAVPKAIAEGASLPARCETVVIPQRTVCLFEEDRDITEREQYARALLHVRCARLEVPVWCTLPQLACLPGTALLDVNTWGVWDEEPPGALREVVGRVRCFRHKQKRGRIPLSWLRGAPELTTLGFALRRKEERVFDCDLKDFIQSCPNLRTIQLAGKGERNVSWLEGVLAQVPQIDRLEIDPRMTVSAPKVPAHVEVCDRALHLLTGKQHLMF